MSSDVQQNNKIVNESSLKETVTNELEKLESTNKWVWTLFFLCFTPNILNGFHVSSYVLLAHISNDMWCDIPKLKESNWTTEEMRNISSTGLTTKGCTVLDLNYSELGHMSFSDALEHTQNASEPKGEVACRSSGVGGSYEFENPHTSIVPEWNLVCEKAVSRTSAQVALSLGKFVGASTFGILSDKYGRKTTFVLASAIYVVSSIIATVSPWYGLFLLGRFGLGSSASGIFYPAFALLSENIGVAHRSWMSIAFSASYPVGMLFLALVGYLIEPWRYLQLALTIPGFLLVLNCYLMFESPRWLLSKNRVADAYKIVFKKKEDIQLDNIPSPKQIEAEAQKPTLSAKLLGSVTELKNLYGESKMRRMAFTCYFMWCVVSLCYYVTALNANNLSANRYVYVLATGCVDLPCYLMPIILLRFLGRRTAAFTLFTLAGIALLVVLAIPQEHVNWLVFFAMFGRFGISAVYSIVTLHTAELFPTEIRNSALGTCSTMAHVGSITAPYIVDVLGLLGWFIPTTICGCSILVAGLLMLTLPETGKRNLVDHVKDDVQNKDNKQ